MKEYIYIPVLHWFICRKQLGVVAQPMRRDWIDKFQPVRTHYNMVPADFKVLRSTGPYLRALQILPLAACNSSFFSVN